MKKYKIVAKSEHNTLKTFYITENFVVYENGQINFNIVLGKVYEFLTVKETISNFGNKYILIETDFPNNLLHKLYSAALKDDI